MARSRVIQRFPAGIPSRPRRRITIWFVETKESENSWWWMTVGDSFYDKQEALDAAADRARYSTRPTRVREEIFTID